jgi:hypothetical protein
MVTSTISSGTIVSSVISGGTTDIVLLGGALVSTTVLSGGAVVVSQGGSAGYTTLQSGGQQIVSSGGVASATNIGYGGVYQVLAGGTDIGAQVGSGGLEALSPGALVSNLTPSSGARVIVLGGSQTISGHGGATISALSNTTLSVFDDTNVNNTIVLGVNDVLSVTGPAWIAASSGSVIYGGVSCNLNIVNGGNVISLTVPGGYAGLVSGSGSIVVANGGTIGAGANVSFRVNGNNNRISATSATGVINGTNDTVIANGGAVISALSNTTLTVAGNPTVNNTILLNSNSILSVTGANWISAANGAQIIAGASCNLNIVNGGNVISMTAPGDYVGLVSGSGSKVFANSGTVGAGANVAFSVTGNGNRISATSANVTVSGMNDTVVANGGAVISALSNTALTVSGANNSIVAANGGTIDTTGNGQVSIGGSATLNVKTGSVAGLTLLNGATVEINGYARLATNTATSTTINFGLSGGILEIDGTTMPSAVIGGFVTSGTIDLRNVGSSSTLAPRLSNNILTVYGADGASYNLTLDPAQNYEQSQVRATPDGFGGVNVSIVNGNLLTPAEWFAGPAYSSDTANYLTALRDLLYSGDFGATGSTVLHIDEWNIAYYTPVMSEIAQYCNAHGIKIAVETKFTPGFGNAWMAAAQMADLPIAYVEDDSEPYNNIASSSELSAALTNIPTIVASYRTELQNILNYYPNVQIGSWNEISQAGVTQSEWNTLSVAYYRNLQTLVNSLQGTAAKSVYALEEYAWNSDPRDITWLAGYTSFSNAMANINVGQVLQLGNYPWFVDVLSGPELNALQEARSAEVATNPALSLLGIDLEYIASTNLNNIPWENGPIVDTGTFANLSAELSAVYPLYQSGLITNTSSVNFSKNNVFLIEPLPSGVSGLPIALPPASWSFGSISVALTSQMNILNATSYGAGTVSGQNTPELIFSGSPTDVAAEMASVTVSATSAATDIIYREIVGNNLAPYTVAAFPNVPLALQIQPPALQDGTGRIAVVAIDQTGILTATPFGSGTVTGSGSHKVILNGSPQDVASALASLAVSEGSAGSDIIDIETFGLYGQLSDIQVVVSTYVPAAGAVINAYSNSTGALTGSSTTGTIAVNNAIVVANPGISANISGSGDTIYLNAGDNAVLAGNSNTVLLAAGDTLTATGTNSIYARSATINGGSGSILSIINGGNSISLPTPGGNVKLVSGSGNSVFATSGTISAGPGISFNVSGNGNSILVGSGGTLNVLGTNTIAGGSASMIIGGASSDLTITNGGNVISLTAPGSIVEVVGGTDNSVIATSGTIVASSGVRVSATGNSNRISATSATVVVGGTSDTVVANGGAVISALSNTTLAVSGGSAGNTIILGTGDVLSVTGVNWIAASSGAQIIGGPGCNLNIVNGGNQITLVAPGDYVGLVSGSGSTVFATSGTIGAGPNVAFSVTGSGNRISATSASEVVSGTNNTVVANGGTVATLSNTSLSLFGNNDKITLGTNNTLLVSGSGNVIYSAQNGADVTFAAGSVGNTVYNTSGVIVKSNDFVVGSVGQIDAQIAAFDPASNTDPNASSLDGLKSAADSAAGIVQLPFEGLKWGSSDITISFAGPDGIFSSGLNGTEQQIAQRALDTWSEASGLDFQVVVDSPSTDIRVGLGEFDTARTGVLGLTSYQSGSSEFQPGVVVRVEDPKETPFVGDATGNPVYSGTEATFYQVLLHEIGHALGLADNADPASIMYYGSGENNPNLDLTDVGNIASLYSNVSTSAYAGSRPRTDFNIQSATTGASLNVVPNSVISGMVKGWFS